MTTLRERCENLFSTIMKLEFERYSDEDMRDISAIESFAREIRNEALKEAANKAREMGKYAMSGYNNAAHEIAKGITALAVEAKEDK